METEVKAVETEARETESNSSAIVPTNPKPDDFLTVGKCEGLDV